jgi:FG-GAP repeat protein
MRLRPRMLLVVAATLAMGAAPSSFAAAAVGPAAPSDFDGDGRADLAIGVPGEDLGGARDAGMVNVLYGAAAGLTAAGDQAWSQDTAGVLGTGEGGPGAAAGDAFGTALASADFDRDGHADLAIGVPLDRVGATTFAGAVNVLYGTSSGLTATGDQIWSQDVLADDPETGDGFGQSLAAGDFDGDGYADLAIGVPGEGLGMGVAPGMVMIIRGGADGLVLAGAAALTRGSTGAPYLADSPHGFGYALVAGDLDGDGYADLAVGAPASGASGDDPLRPLVNGEAAVFYGSETGLATAGSQLWTQATVGVGIAGAGDWFGSSLAIGDFDADHLEDLAIGARFARVNGVVAGAVNVLYGTIAGVSSTGSQHWDQDDAGVPGAAEVGDTFGHAVAAGDLNGDGRADLAIGVPGEAFGSGWNGAGLVDVLYGSADGLSAAGAQAWSQDSPGVPGASEAAETAWDAFGSALAIANFGRTAHADLAIGVHLERLGNHPEAGMVNVLYGRSSGLSGVNAQGWSQDSAGVQGAVETRDYFGTSLTP